MKALGIVLKWFGDIAYGLNLLYLAEFFYRNARRLGAPMEWK